MKYSGIGGQAVIEGIMMMNGNDYAIAVRKPDGDIEVKKDTYVSITRKHKFLGLQFYRFHGCGHEGPDLVLQFF